MRVADFADEIIKLFPPYRWDESTALAWSSAVVRECGVFDATVRKRAFDELVRKHKGSTPAVAAVLNFCIEAKRWTEAEGNEGRLPLDSKPSGYLWTEERKRLANELLRTSLLAKRALKECWHLAFRDFVRTHGHAPKEDAEIRECMRGARDFDEAMEDLRNAPPPAIEDQTHRDPEDTWVRLGDVPGLLQSLGKLGMSMLQTRDDTARIIKGER